MSAVSAIVVSYFTGPVLKDCIAALRADPAVAEIVLVDNGNDPGAVEAAIDDGDGDGAPVRVLTGHGNVGFAAACNKGARCAAGDVFLFINPDAVMPPGGVSRMMADAAALSRPWLMGARLVGPDGAEQQGARRADLTPICAISEAAGLYRFGAPRFNLHKDPLPDRIVPMATLSGACLLVPSADYQGVGGMDEGYFLHVEDVDFCKRFRGAGGGVWFNPHVSVAHVKGSSRARALTVEAHKTRGLIRYFNTHAGWPAPGRWMLAGLLWGAYGAKAAKRALQRKA